MLSERGERLDHGPRDVPASRRFNDQSFVSERLNCGQHAPIITESHLHQSHWRHNSGCSPYRDVMAQGGTQRDAQPILCDPADRSRQRRSERCGIGRVHLANKQWQVNFIVENNHTA